MSNQLTATANVPLIQGQPQHPMNPQHRFFCDSVKIYLTFRPRSRTTLLVCRGTENYFCDGLADNPIKKATSALLRQALAEADSSRRLLPLCQDM